jgi:hypothetical protein
MVGQSDDIEKTVVAASRVVSGKGLEWVRTRQDFKAALMIAPETGFPTGGSLSYESGDAKDTNGTRTPSMYPRHDAPSALQSA